MWVHLKELIAVIGHVKIFNFYWRLAGLQEVTISVQTFRISSKAKMDAPREKNNTGTARVK